MNSVMHRISRVIVWCCAMLLLQCKILLHMRGNWILGDDRGIWFVSFWGPCKVVTMNFTSVQDINIGKEGDLSHPTYTGTSLLGSGQD